MRAVLLSSTPPHLVTRLGGLTHRADEVDPYKKPAELLEVSPKGLVPALKLHTYAPPRALNESTVILEYLEEYVELTTHSRSISHARCLFFFFVLELNSLAGAEGTTGKTLLPPRTDPYARALVRLQADHVSRTLVPAFYRFLQAQDPDAQASGAHDFARALEHLASLLERGAREVQAARTLEPSAGPGSGLWVEDGELNWTDVMAGPCEFSLPFLLLCIVWIDVGGGNFDLILTLVGLFRASNVLRHYRAFELPPESESKVRGWLNRLVAHPAFKATCSAEQLYLDSYER
jgi:glutathione S-transferase